MDEKKPPHGGKSKDGKGTPKKPRPVRVARVRSDGSDPKLPPNGNRATLPIPDRIPAAPLDAGMRNVLVFDPNRKKSDTERRAEPDETEVFAPEDRRAWRSEERPKSGKARTERNPRGAGRPSLYTPELGQDICIRIALGATTKRVSEEAGMPSEITILRWRLQHAEFGKHYQRAIQIRNEYWAEEMITIADETGDPQKAAVQIKARQFYISKSAPKRWGDKAGEGDQRSLEEVAHRVNQIARQIRRAFEESEASATEEEKA